LSIFDTINATADSHKAAQWTAYRQETWWQDKDIWTECGANQSTTEYTAYSQIARECGALLVNRLTDLLELVQEVLTETRQERAIPLMPLKAYLAQRYETLYWREPGLSPAAYVVPIVATG
jgi:hypothetical protein